MEGICNEHEYDDQYTNPDITASVDPQEVTEVRTLLFLLFSCTFFLRGSNEGGYVKAEGCRGEGGGVVQRCLRKIWSQGYWMMGSLDDVDKGADEAEGFEECFGVLFAGAALLWSGETMQSDGGSDV